MSPSTTSSITALTSSATAQRQAGSILGKDDFLKLLVTQLRNQDPLSPVDQNEFIAQTAQFTSLEELQNIRKALEAQQTASDFASLSQAAGFVGRQIQASTASVSFNGSGAVSLPFTLGSDAADVQVEIMGSAGQVVRTIHTGARSAGSNSAVWDGKSGSGSPLSPGAYSYRVTALDTQGQPIGAAVAVSGIVESVRLKDGQPVFTVNGQTVRLRDVTAILQAAAN